MVCFDVADAFVSVQLCLSGSQCSYGLQERWRPRLAASRACVKRPWHSTRPQPRQGVVLFRSLRLYRAVHSSVSCAPPRVSTFGAAHAPICLTRFRPCSSAPAVAHSARMAYNRFHPPLAACWACAKRPSHSMRLPPQLLAVLLPSHRQCRAVHSSPTCAPRRAPARGVNVSICALPPTPQAPPAPPALPPLPPLAPGPSDFLTFATLAQLRVAIEDAPPSANLSVYIHQGTVFALDGAPLVVGAINLQLV